MRSVFSGPFRAAGAAASRDPKPSEPFWRCRFCSSSNHDDQADACVLCKRPRLPEWLHVKAQAFDVDIGVQVILPGDPGGNVLGVVTEIDLAKRNIVLMVTKESTRSKTQALAFSAMSYNAGQIQELRLVTDQSDRGYLDSLGICGDCRCVFRVLSCDQPPAEDAKLEVALLQAQVTTLLAQKQQMIRIKQFDAVLSCATHIKELQAQIQLAKRKLEYANVALCPYCGWCAS